MFRNLGYRIVQTIGRQPTSYLLETDGPYESIDSNVSRDLWKPNDLTIIDGYGTNNVTSLENLRLEVNNSEICDIIKANFEIRIVDLWVGLTEHFFLENQSINDGLVLFHPQDMAPSPEHQQILGYEVIEGLTVSAMHNMWSYGPEAVFERNFFKAYLNQFGLFSCFESARSFREILSILHAPEGAYHIARICKMDWFA